MSRRFTLKSLGLCILAAALIVAFTPAAAVAQSADASVVRTVPAINAPALITARVDDSRLSPLGTPVVPGLKEAKDLGPASPDMKMGMQLLLQRSLQQKQALALLDSQALQPGSSMYGKVFTPTEFAETFGLAASDLATLKSALESAGFTVGNVDNGRLTIDFEGTVAQVNAAFHTDIHNYSAKDGSQHYAPATGLQIPRALVPAVESVSGLQNFAPLYRPGFNGPVTDFAAGTIGEKAAMTTGKATAPRLDGEALHDSSFTASKYVLGLTGSTTLNVRIGGNTHPVTGSLAIENQNGKVVGYVADITACEPYGSYGRSCTADYQPPVGGGILHAIYSGDENTRGGNLGDTIITKTGTGMGALANSTAPIALYSTPSALASTTMTTVLSYYGIAANTAPPTGTVTIYWYSIPTDIWAELTLPATAGGTSSGTGTSYFGNAYTYSCAGNIVSQTVTCTTTMANAYADAISKSNAGGQYTLVDAYFGDTNYAGIAGANLDAAVYGQLHASTVAPMVMASGDPVTGTYGTVTTGSPTVTITCTTCAAGQLDGNSIEGSGLAASLLIQGASATGLVANFAQQGVGHDYSLEGSCMSATTCTLNMLSWKTPMTLAPGSYQIGFYYSGGSAVTGNTVGPATGTYTFTQAQFTPTLSAVTAAPASVGLGTSTPVTLSDTFTIPTVGVLPSGAVTFTLNSVAYTATCIYTSTAGEPACSATVPGATIAALPTGTYTITSAFAGDGYYSMVTTGGGTGTLEVLPATTTTMVSPVSTTPQTEGFGALTAFAVSGQIAYTSATAPTTATFSSTAAGTFGTVTCTGSSSPVTCSATFTPTATDAVGTYNINLVFAGDANNAASSSSQVGNFTITPGTITTIQITTSAYATPPTLYSTQAYGGTTAFTVYATLSPIGTTGVTAADVTFATSTAGIGTFGATTCTASSGVDLCNALFTPNGTAAVGSYNINASFSGDANYNAAGPSTNGTGLYVVTNASPTLTFSPSPITSIVGSTTPISVTVTASNGDTGTVNFTGAYATYGTLSATSCMITATSCSVSFTPNGATAIGSYSNILTADLPANGNYNDATANDSLTVAGNTTYTVVTPGTTSYTVNGNSTFTAVVSWVKAGVTPTGTLVLMDTTNGRALGGVTLPATTGTCSPTPYTGACTYACTTSTVSQTISCTFTDSSVYAFLSTTTEDNLVTATYAGDTNFAGAAGTTNVYYNQSGGTAVTVTTDTATLAAATYGLTQAETATVTVTSNAVTDPYPFQDGSGAFLQATSTLQNGTLYTTNDSACGSMTTTCVISGGSTGATAPLFTVPAVVTPNTYTVTYTYAGDYSFATGYDETGFVTASLTVNQQTPTFGAMTFSPAAMEPYGTSQAITISDTLQYLGVGAAPTGAVTFTLNSVGYAATCTATGSSGAGNSQVNSETCSATVAAAVIAALSPNTYTVTVGYTADINYGMATGTSGTFTITPDTATLTIASGTYVGGTNTTASGVTSTVLTATLSPAASGSTVTFTDVTTGATIGTATTNSMGVATITVNAAGTGAGQSSKPSGGLNMFSASATATAYTLAASTIANSTVYYQGILFSTVGAHDFSGLIMLNSQTVEGTADGTKLGPYGVSVYNFTPASQPLPLTLTNPMSGAFSVANQCSNPLPAGGACTFNFYYAPPAGDGCSVGGTCALDGSGYPEGTFESAPWSAAVSAGVLTGIGDRTFDRSGPATPAGTLEGKAILAPLSLGITPLTAAFGNVTQNSTSQTITITVQNTNMAAVPFLYAGPTLGHFTAINSCNSPLAANSSCSIFLTMVTATTGTFSDSLTITPSGGTASTGTMSGTVAAGSGGITLSSNNHNFGNVTDGTTATYGVSLTNHTASAATLSFSNSAGTGYTTSNSCGASLAAGKSCNYGFTFAPTTPGAANDTLTITSSVPILPGGTGSGPYTGTVTVSGTGVAGGHLTATSVTHNFGSLAIGTSGGNYGVEITNSTSAAVTLSYSGLTGGANGFSVVGTTCGASLAINQNCELVFTFTPVAAGYVTGTYPITSSSPLYGPGGNQVSPSQITLQGTGN